MGVKMKKKIVQCNKQQCCVICNFEEVLTKINCCGTSYFVIYRFIFEKFQYNNKFILNFEANSAYA